MHKITFGLVISTCIFSAMLAGCEEKKKDATVSATDDSIPDDILPAPRNSTLTDDLNRAVKLIADGKYGDAITKLSTLTEQFQRGNDLAHTVEAIFWIGFCEEKRGQISKARKQYLAVILKRPNSDAAKMANMRLDFIKKNETRP